jgi:hypothetical protein
MGCRTGDPDPGALERMTAVLRASSSALQSSILREATRANVDYVIRPTVAETNRRFPRGNNSRLNRRSLFVPFGSAFVGGARLD